MRSNTFGWLVAAIGALGTGGLVMSSLIGPEEDAEPRREATDMPPAARFPVVINRPAGTPRTPTDRVDDLGQPVTVSCSSCHSIRSPDPSIRRGADLEEFHAGLTFAHGELSCASCHNPADYDTLRLADGTVVEYADVMTLCSQCHGPQRLDYDHGAHGGMNGYWDLSRGPRSRNGCVDCHDAHAPAFPKMRPTFKPIDRFLEAEQHDASGGSHE